MSSTKTYVPGRSCSASCRDTSDSVGCDLDREINELTRARLRVNTNVRWALKIRRKYRVASSAIVLKIVGILNPCFSDLAARKTIKRNARESDYSYFLSSVMLEFQMTPTHRTRGRYLCSRPLGVYSGGIRRGGMHRGVLLEGVRLHGTERAKKGSLDSET